MAPHPQKCGCLIHFYFSSLDRLCLLFFFFYELVLNPVFPFVLVFFFPCEEEIVIEIVNLVVSTPLELS